jgi:hypothetical protein
MRSEKKSTMIHAASAKKHRWFMPVILSIQEAEMKRIKVQSLPRQIVPGTLSLKNPSQKKKKKKKKKGGGVD